jgi:hypothetical protein
MDKRILTFLTCVVCLGFSPVKADDVVIVDRMGNDSIVSGQITRISGESVYVENMGREIEVELDNLDLDHFNDLFAPGMTVTARGHFQDKTNPILKFRADEIVRADNNSALNSEALLLNNDHHH